MNGEVGTEAVRPRPLSGGLWTLFSWLRREDRLSTESISSVGSDRTVASFAFLGPGKYASPAPILLPPQGPPTDSYRKRVRDRNLRWQHDRDITIHRKYGLYGYDAFSLPNARRGVNGTPTDRCERDRRATSESFPRRVHVPGKRRAPLPPSSTVPTSLNRRRARKRQAPQPPPNITLKTNQNDTDTKDLKMNPERNIKTNQQVKISPEPANKFEKKYKKDTPKNDVKVKQEKSFLKQIFENKKRHSAIETSTVKLLPNISELDKQAAEIIEKYKLKELDQTLPRDNINDNLPGTSNQLSESWICTRCLRKYNGSVVTCSYCLPIQKSSYSNSNKNHRISNSFTQTNNGRVNEVLEDKEKLKEMLKEMKDSLHKKQNKQSDQTEKPHKEIQKDYPRNVETPTLRIGSTVTIKHHEPSSPQPSSSTDITTTSNLNRSKELTTIDSVIVTQPLVLEHTKENIVILDKTTDIIPKTNENDTKMNSKFNIGDVKSNKPLKENDKGKSDNDRHLKISSLLNPIYIPKTLAEKTQQNNVQAAGTSSTSNASDLKNNFLVSNNEAGSSRVDITTQIKATDTKGTPSNNGDPPKEENKLQPVSPITIKKPLEKNIVPTASTSSQVTSNIISKLDEHSRRRELVNQLERSIAKGDERAAADAAIKLAQLRLTCSVLSFSSQIIAEPAPSSSAKLPSTHNEPTKNNNTSQIPTKSNTTIVGYALNQNNVPKGFNIVNQSKQPSTKIIDKIKENLEKKDIRPTEDKNSISLGQPGSSFSVVNPLISTKNETDDKKLNTETVPAVASTSTGNIKTKDDEEIPILVWVEDKETTRGPIQLHIRRRATVGELRKQADKSLGLAVRMQRWIVGQTLCSDDNTALITVAGPELNAPFYLCLVEPEAKANLKVEDKEVNAIGDVYKELVNLEKQALVANAEEFECGVCIEKCASGEGVVLRDCVHSFCKECLSDVVKHSEEPIVTCPAMGCRGILQEREIRALVTPEDYQKWLARGLAVAESGTRNAFHCRTRDCTGWALCEPGVRRFPCPVCKYINCVPCQAIHEGETCEQYKANLENAASTTDASQTDDGTRELLNSLIARGEALECPECKAIITKKWGCDWVKCSACKTEICWVTRGRRWGPGGRGDTSGGCRCGVDGKKCHPSCSYCH